MADVTRFQTPPRRVAAAATSPPARRVRGGRVVNEVLEHFEELRLEHQRAGEVRARRVLERVVPQLPADLVVLFAREQQPPRLDFDDAAFGPAIFRVPPLP